MKAVIMAGGRGTRVSAITKDEIPKPMISICGKPILRHQIERLQENGINEIIVVIGHRGEKVVEFLGNGNNFGVNISYVQESTALGTAGSLYYLKQALTEDFLFLYGDIIFDVDLARMLYFHNKKMALATLFVHPNTHPYDSDLVIVNKRDEIIGFDSKHNVRNYFYDNRVNAGIFLLSPQIIATIQEAEKLSLEQNIIEPLLDTGRIFAYHSSEYVKDAGTPERIQSVETDIRSGLVSIRNFKNRQKCIFLDRDGTINRYRGLLYNEKDFELEESAVAAIKKINASPYLCVVITNQPVVARGLCGTEDIEAIHKKMVTLLGREGAYVDDIYFCPHHPDKGYEGENVTYKMKCHCRKPAIGMLEEAAQKYNISLEDSFFVGDTTVDIQTGQNAKCKTVLVLTGEHGADQKYDNVPDIVARDLSDAVDCILGGIK